MALAIDTFRPDRGGNVFFKAISHPLAAARLLSLLQSLAGKLVALYDPLGHAVELDALLPLAALQIARCFVQNVERVGRPLLGRIARPVTELPASRAQTVLVAAFDAERLVDQIRHLLPPGADCVTLDEARLPAKMQTTRPYLHPLNFATNFAFFRDGGGHHSRLVTANYWSGYGADAPVAWCRLYGAGGDVLAEWSEPLPEKQAGFVIDSAEVRRRFGLRAFEGQLFLHMTAVAGHDVLKYALDTYGDAPTVLSATHDANAWPADRYAGLPAPAAHERVILWLQNSQPRAVPPGEIGLRRMGRDELRRVEQQIPAFGTLPLDTRTLFPELAWPAQFEIEAGKWMVRPRYEVETATGRRRIAHVNVERNDLTPDAAIAAQAVLLGKGFLLPAPVLPADRFATTVLPTPMASRQQRLPVQVAVYDPDGRELARQSMGALPRDHASALEVGCLLGGGARWGHLELSYDFSQGSEADGWLHALLRYEDRATGHAAETSFGAHLFNTVLTFHDEPQSYAGRPPGLSTRLFLPLAPDLAGDTAESFCHLIYPASTPWHPRSRTELILVDGSGQERARETVAIACSGSLFFRVGELFGRGRIRSAGLGAYVLVRDQGCRLFGYGGLVVEGQSFSLDHLFGF